jgi:hypothetical protein
MSNKRRHVRRIMIALFGAATIAGCVAAIPVASALSSTCTTSAAMGACGPYDYPRITSPDEPTVGQDVWNPIAGWQQTLYATDPGSWHVTANMPAGNTAVVSFPNTGADYDEKPLSSFGSVVSSFSETSPGAGPGKQNNYDTGFDLWLNHWNNEVMIQMDNYGSQSVGTCPFIATATFGGSNGVPVQHWGLCQFGSELIWQLSQGHEPTGSVDILSMLTWLEDARYLPAASTVTAFSYGFEICSTGGQNETFGVNSFSITVTAVPANSDATDRTPTATTGGVTGLSSSGATLHGTVNPGGETTTYRFEYGATTRYGSSVPAPVGSAGSGTSPVRESAAIGALLPSTAYHYRIEAIGPFGTAYGRDRRFTTPPGVGYDATSSAGAANTSSLTWTQEVGDGGDRALLVEATVGTGDDIGCSGVITDNGQKMSELATIHTDNKHAGYLAIWGLVNPPSGANEIALTVRDCSGGKPLELTGGAESFTGVSQLTPFGPVRAEYGDGSTASATVAAASPDDIVGSFIADGSGNESAWPPAATRFVQDVDLSSGAGNSAGATSPAAAPRVTVKWTMYSDYWAECVVDIHYA